MRRPLPVLALAVVVVVLVVLAVSGSGGGSSQTAAQRRLPAPAVESGLLPWRLPNPVSREVVLPAGGRLLVLGGLTGSTSAASIVSVAPITGGLRQMGSLKAGVHDGSGAVIGGRYFVFGGGTPNTVPTVQSLPAGGTPGHLGPFPGGPASLSGSLPQPRSDSASATIGATAYVVGGYNGSTADPVVLSTTDGRTFKRVASLPVPVRYAAVAALGGRLYVFGGEAVTGSGSGQPVNVIQLVDPRAGTASVVGHLPEPLQGAAAVTLHGHVYLAGGDSSAPSPGTPGVGTTQLSPPISPRVGAGLVSVSDIWALDPVRNRMLPAGHLQVPVSHSAVAVVGSRAWLVGGESGGTQLTTVQMITPNRAFGAAGDPGAGSPYFGYRLLIADRGNNRLLLLNPANQIVWRFPSPSLPKDKLGFYFPDDAFFIHHGTGIITNEEQNETVQEIAFPSGKVLWSYGHPRQPGAGPGYLHEPDDAYLLKSGDIAVADADNCRVLVLRPNHTIAHQIGKAGACVHNPPHALYSVNGDTPLADGNLLVSEINDSRVSEYTLTGHTVWSLRLPISYPSDPQQLGPDLYLLADYATPGEIVEFNRGGKILYRYRVASGPGMLNQPSLVERIPSGVFMINDDYRHRMAAIDPATRALVWQYGVNDSPGQGPGRLRIPDGFDLLGPHGSTPTHPVTG